MFVLIIFKNNKEIVKNKIPEKLYIKITADLEKQNVKAKKSKEYRSPSGMIRGPKEFYTFEIDQNDTINIKTIEFSHENSSIFFNLKEESDGTARLLDLIEILFKVSDNHTFVIDEIDRCLHPIMTEKIIELFLKMAEYRNTQLIITSHESRLLTDDLLRNDEINFILKTPNGSSIINPLEKYQLRTDKKVYAALFDGTLDAIPKFNTSKLELSRYAIWDSESNSYTVSAFLIAQFGKNYAVDEGKGINGNELMDLTFEILEERHCCSSASPIAPSISKIFIVSNCLICLFLPLSSAAG